MDKGDAGKELDQNVGIWRQKFDAEVFLHQPVTVGVAGVRWSEDG
jgi:hypothetical protein